MKQTTNATYLLVALLLVGTVNAVVDPCDQGKGVKSIDCECQDFGYDYGIAKWECKESGYNRDGSEKLGFDTKVEGTCQEANWTAKPYIAGLVVKAGQESNPFSGGDMDTIQAWDKHDISHVTFCGRSGGSCTTCGGGDENGVPEFSTLTLGLAAIASTMGLVYLRKR